MKQQLRPNTELLKEEVSQSLPRFVDISKGTLTVKTKRSEAINKATLRKKNKQFLDTIYNIWWRAKEGCHDW